MKFHVRGRRSFATSAYDVIRSNGTPGDWTIVRTFADADKAIAYADQLNRVAAMNDRARP